MADKLTITTFDGHNINDGTTYEAKFLRFSGVTHTFESVPVAAEVAGDFPEYARGQPGGRVYPLWIKVADSTLANIRQLKKWMTPFGDEVLLKVTDTASVTWRLTVKCVQLVNWEGTDDIFVARLWAARPIWESDTEHSDTQANKSASPINYDIDNNGCTRTPPIFEITPTASKNHANGYKRRWQVIIANKVPRALQDTLGFGYPLDIVNDGLDTATEVAASRMQADGDDLRVYIDGKQIATHKGVDRWFQNINNATTQVWCNVYYKPRQWATLDGAMTAESPADGESINVDNAEGTAGWPESGLLTFEDNDECIHYASKSPNSFDEITRGVRNTTAAVHADAQVFYWVEHEIVLEYDYTAAANPPAPDDTKPIIVLNSTNGGHIYATDFVLPETKRSGQWRPYYTQENALAPILSLIQTAFNLGFYDSPATAGRHPYNNVELYVPCEVKVAADALEHDVGSTLSTNGHHLLLRLYGRDTAGHESFLASYYYTDIGDDLNVTPVSELVRLRWNGLHAVVTGADSNSDESSQAIDQTVADYRYFQKIVLDEDTKVAGLAVRLKKQGAGTVNARMKLIPDNAGDPDRLGTVTAELDILNADLDTDWKTVMKMYPAVIALPAGTYWLALGGEAGNTVDWEISETADGSRVYTRGHVALWTGSYYNHKAAENCWFRIIDDGATAQPEAPSNSGGYRTLDEQEITLDTPPYVFVCPSEEIYSYGDGDGTPATLENLTTGQSMTIHFVSELSKKLTINCEMGTVTSEEDGLDRAVPWAVTWADEIRRLHLDPGSNSLRYTEASIGTLGIVTKHRDRW